MQQLLKELPKVDKLALEPAFKNYSKKILTNAIREELNILRNDILKGKISSFSKDELIKNIQKRYKNTLASSLKPLINATGVILHTNMGRSLISKEILDRASRVICRYSNLEYNQKEGKRGERYEHVSHHLKSLLDVEDVLVVNNNASAVFLILNTFAKNKEVIVSRGELVEIGGSFRIPEVMANSGAILKEVGATNKTKKSDYECAINENTSMVMKVHKSNYSIEGFAQDVSFRDIKDLATKYNLIDYFDLGSGYIPTLPYNLSSAEPPLAQVLKDKPSLISFSGDKLFGSVQAGIIAGKKELIDKLKRNQLLRMVRVDKITLSILEETIKAYLEENLELIPTLKMLFQTKEELLKKATTLKNKIKSDTQIIQTLTFMGGGTLPNRSFESIALKISGKATALEAKFREKDIIGRIENNSFLLDVRTILDDEIDYVAKVANEVME